MTALDSIVRLLALGASVDVVSAFGTIAKGKKSFDPVAIESENVNAGIAECPCQGAWTGCQVTGPGSLSQKEGSSYESLRSDTQSCWEQCYAPDAVNADLCNATRTTWINSFCAETSRAPFTGVPGTPSQSLREALEYYANYSDAPNPVVDGNGMCSSASATFGLHACSPEAPTPYAEFTGANDKALFPQFGATTWSMLSHESIQFFGTRSCEFAAKKAIAQLETLYPDDYRLKRDDDKDSDDYREEFGTKATICGQLYRYTNFAKNDGLYRTLEFCTYRPSTAGRGAAMCMPAAINEFLAPYDGPDDDFPGYSDNEGFGADANNCQFELCKPGAFANNRACWETSPGVPHADACKLGVAPSGVASLPCVGPCTAPGVCYIPDER